MSFSRPLDFNLSQRLTQVLAPDQGVLLRLVADEAVRQQLPLYLVGGFVRDFLLGLPNLDFDLVVEGDAITLGRALAARHGGKVTVHSRFGTAQWYLPASLSEQHSSLDLISARSETYAHPAALPRVKRGTLDDDLRRRDFTINTLALRLDGDHFGELQDSLGGLDDLEQGLIRVLHPHSFVDDPTRLFRAVRYEQRYGFHIARKTLALVPEARSLIANLSPERVRHELDLILVEDNAASMLKRLSSLKILPEVHPCLMWDQNIHKRFEKMRQVPPVMRHVTGWMLWLMHLSSKDIGQIDRRLHFHANLRNEILAASALFAEMDSLAGKKPSQCVAILDEFPLPAVQAVSLVVMRGKARMNLQKYVETWRHVRLKTTGYVLQKLGLPPGPVYQKILQTLKAAWLDGEISSPEQEKERLHSLLDEYS